MRSNAVPPKATRLSYVCYRNPILSKCLAINEILANKQPSLERKEDICATVFVGEMRSKRLSSRKTGPRFSMSTRYQGKADSRPVATAVAPEGRPNRRTAGPCAPWAVPPPLGRRVGYRSPKLLSTRSYLQNTGGD